MIKVIEISNYMVLDSVFANNTVLRPSFFFFLMIDLYFLILAVIAQIFYPTAELAIPIGIPTNEAKAEIETDPVNTGGSIYLKDVQTF